jgi:hypothetical protein
MQQVVQAEHVHLRIASPLHILHVIYRLLGGLKRKHRLGRDLLGECQPHRRQFVTRHDPVHHAARGRVPRADLVRREQEFLDLADAQFPGMIEELDAADAEVDHRVLERGIVAGDDQVAHPGQHQPSGDAFALHLGDGGLGQAAPALTDGFLVGLRRITAHASPRRITGFGHKARITRITRIQARIARRKHSARSAKILICVIRASGSLCDPIRVIRVILASQVRPPPPDAPTRRADTRLNRGTSISTVLS